MQESLNFNPHIRDLNSKMIFRNAILCSQFLRDNVNIPALKNVQPEDIEDVTERYQPFIGMESEADTVKQIHISPNAIHLPADTSSSPSENKSIFLISLIEHKSQVDYNVSIQLLRYMACIWTEYGKEMERRQKGCTKSKNFCYPPVLTIVYYEGTQSWSAGMHLRDRIWMSDVFGTYLPDFTYQVIRIHDYSNEELLARENEMSLLMLINKIQAPQDISRFLSVKPEQFDKILQKSEEPVLDIIASTLWGLLMKMNVPQTDARRCVEKVKERQMGYLFENMEKMDIQAERRNTAEARAQAAEALAKLEEAQAKANEAEAKANEAEAKANEAEAKVAEAQANLQKVKQTLEIMTQQLHQKNQPLLQMLLSLCQNLGMTQEDTLHKLVTECGLTDSEAQSCLDKYWK